MPAMPLTPPKKAARHSLDVLDRFLERAFAPREMAITSPTALSAPPLPIPPPVARTPSPEHGPDESTGEPGAGAHFGGVPDEELAEPPASLETLWEEVRSSKSKELAGSPSKVKSLEGAVLASVSGLGLDTEREQPALPQPPQKKRVQRRRSSVSFKESPDGKNLMVTFDMTGVKKQDMHVSYRTNRLIVAWRIERIAERRDGDVVVRDREVRKYSHTVPLPEGTKFEEVRASRDGQKLMLTIPNSKCVRANAAEVSEAEAEDGEVQPTDPRTIPDFETAISAVSEYHSCAPTHAV